MKKPWSVRLRQHLLTGLLVVAPLVITYLVLRFLYETLESVLGPTLRNLLGLELPGIGILALLLAVWLLGALVSRVLGRGLFHWWEGLVARIPLVGTVYRAARQTVEVFARPSEESFQRVCLVPFPLESDSWALGFVTGQSDPLGRGKPLVHVFLPAPPLPSGGLLVLVEPERVRYLDWSVPEAMQFIISFGSLSPGGPTPIRFSELPGPVPRSLPEGGAAEDVEPKNE